MHPASLDVARRHRDLRAAVAHARPGGPTHAARSTTGDDTTAALTADPFVDIADADARLGALLEHFEAHDDRRAIFLEIYARMTSAVADRVAHREFEDPPWVGAYLVAFADHYRRAVHRYETGRRDAVPEPWRVAFDAARDGTGLVTQDAALGVNAHINYDLALALHDVGVDANRRRRRRDHDAVIDVIRTLVDDAQDGLAARDADGIAIVDDALGPVDEWLTVTTIDGCRTSAWRTAVALDSRFRARRRFARWWNATTASGAARLIHASHGTPGVHDALVDAERAGD